MTTLDQAVQQMLAAGMPPFPDGGPRLAGRIVRYGPKKKAWYVLHEYPARNGRLYITGAFGCWGLIESTKIETDWTGAPSDELQRLKRSQAELEARERAKRDLRARHAANRAKQQWHAARAAGESPYLKRKGVEPEKGLRFFADGTLVVPMLRYDITEEQEKDPTYTGLPRLVGVQKIAPDGVKRFNRNMAKAGAACRLGRAPKDGEILLIVEGVATGLSVRAGVGRSRPVFVAFDAYNLAAVARILRALCPTSPIVFCADDDFATEGNPGVAMAKRAAEAAANAHVVQPHFLDAEKRAANKWTDFNDLHQALGVAAIEAQLEPVLAQAAGGAPPVGRDKGGGGDEEPDWGLHDQLLEQFAFIYPSDTAFDGQLVKIVKIEHMRLMFGRKATNLWLASPRRRTVFIEQVVFDPTQRSDPNTTVNLFRGITMKPDGRGRASCEKLLKLLFYLCGEDELVYEWVLKWTALPLQRVGAKMQTAIVMHGEEGTGKNLFWGAVRAIYGEHGTIISQMQLNSQFNDWLSARLFILANEVVTRQEMTHHVGILKNLVTEPEIWINPKNVGARAEGNHANLVFLSNELQPLKIGLRDRRYMVIRTPNERDEEFYRAVGAEVDAGGAAALYHYLREDVELEGFTEHTKPPMTEAKEDLIELGMAPSQLFWKELKQGILGLPYVPALVTDVYRGYTTWCLRNGFKMPEGINRFKPHFMAMNGVAAKVDRVPDPGVKVADEKKTRQRKIFVMGERDPDPQRERLRVLQGIDEFRQRLKDYLGEDRVYASGPRWVREDGDAA